MIGGNERRAGIVGVVLTLVLGVAAPGLAQRAYRRAAVRPPAAAGVAGELVAWGDNTFGQRNLPAAAQGGIRGFSAGTLHNLAIKTDGTVIAWGPTGVEGLDVPPGLSNVVAVQAGSAHSVALKSDGTVVAWGRNLEGQTNVPPGLSGVVQIATAGDFTVALKDDGTVTIWGDNERGVITKMPAGLSGVKAVAAGYYHALALKCDGTVVAWGENGSGESTVPNGLSGVVTIAAAYGHSAALKADGTVVAWGDNEYGQSSVPPGLSGVRAIVTGDFYTAALKSDGTVVSWGDTPDYHAVPPPGLTGVTALEAGVAHVLALRPRSRIYAWGYSADGGASVPAGLTDARTVVGGFAHSLAVRSDGTVAAWGRNVDGQTSVPGGLGAVFAVSAGSAHSVALKSDGTMASWGSNTFGQRNVPGGLSGVAEISTGSEFNAALKSDGTVAVWGSDPNGQLVVPGGLSSVKRISASGAHVVALKGDGTVTEWGLGIAPPGGLSGVKEVAAGLFFALALKSDGTVVGWGDNTYGQASPPGGLTGVIAISAGDYHGLALKADGTVVAWGRNHAGQLNQPEGLTGVTAVEAGAIHSLALAGNVPPQVSNPGAQQALEDQATSDLPFTIGDVDTGTVGLTVTAECSVPSLVQDLRLGGSGANRTLRIVPATNANGSATITLTVSDGYAVSTSSFPLTVTPVNDAPTFVRGLDPTVAEDAGPQTIVGWATGIQPGPTADEFVQNLEFQVTNNTNPSLFSVAPAVNGTTGDLTFKTAPNASGTATLSLLLHDDGGTATGGVDVSGVQQFTLTVTPVNDAPVATADRYETEYATPLTVAAPGVLENDVEPEGSPLTAVLVSGPNSGSVALNPDGSFVYAPLPGYTGTVEFTYQASDGTALSAPVVVSVGIGTTPPSTPNAKVTGSGTVLVNGVKVKFTVSAAFKRKVTGKLTFKDPNPSRQIKKSRLESVVVSGRHARVYGLATLPDRSLVPFVADLDDPAPGGGPDRFGLALKNGQVVPSSVVTGKVTIK